METVLAFAQLLFRSPSLGDVLSEYYDATDRARPVVPWPDLPPNPLHGTIGPIETVAFYL
jgi:hypothetical protein